MLRAIPKGWWTLKYELFKDELPVGLIEFNFGSEGATITIGDARFTIRSEGWFGKTYILKSSNSRPLATAENSALSGRFTVNFNNRSYSLEKESGILNPNYVLIDGSGILGSIRPDGMLSRKSTIDLPTDISIEVQAFIFWLVALLWKRSSDAAAAT